MKDLSIKNRLVLVPSLLILLLFRPPNSTAQADPNPGSDTGSSEERTSQIDSQQKNEGPANQPAAGVDANPELPHPPATLASPLFRLTGGLLQPTQSPFRLGPIYLSSAEVLGVYNAFSPLNNPANNASYIYARTGTLMRANIVLDEIFKTVRLTTQWEPRLSIFDGTAYPNLDNGVASLDANFHLTERLKLNLSDLFSYFATSLLYGDYFLTTGMVEIPASQLNSFLDAPGHSLSNIASANLTYQLTPLTKLSFLSSFNYFHTNTETLLLNSSYEQQYSLRLNHSLSEKTAIGLGYSLSLVRFQTNPNNVAYQYVTGNYSHLFSPNLSVIGSAGFSTYQIPNNSRSWTFTGSATLTKTFGASSLSINYLRDLYLFDYITTDFTDRVDGQYRRRLGQRLSLQLGAGFQKEERPDGYQGNYAQTGLSFRLSPMLDAYARYTYSHQTGDQQFLVTGTTNLVVFGLSFQAAPTALPQR